MCMFLLNTFTTEIFGSTWGYSGREVAKIMGMAEQTIYTKRNRLRKKLKNLSKIE